MNFEEADPVSLPGHADYEAIKKLHGFAYYLVEKDGELKLVKNGNYKQVPEPVWLSPQEYKKIRT